MKININDYYEGITEKGRIKSIIILTCVLMFIAFQSVLIYAFFLSANISYGASAPKIILDKTEEVYITKLASVIELCGKNFTGYDYKKTAQNNTDTIETTLIAVLDSASGDTLETVLTSRRLLFNRPYSFKHLRTASRVLEEYARIRIEKKDAAGAVRAINSIMSLAMVPQIGIESEKALICDIITYVVKSHVTVLIGELIRCGAKIAQADLERLTAKLAKYEARCDDFAEALRHEKEACARLIEQNFLGIHPKSDRFEKMMVLTFVKASELYYGNLTQQYISVMDKAIKAAGLKFAEADKKLEELAHLEKEINKSTIYILAVLKSEINPLLLPILPSYEEFYRKFMVQRAHTRASIIKLAARRIEDAGGRDKLPAVIDGFKSDPYIKANPWVIEDPFSGNPLLYKKGETGEITLYSTSYDTKDDGGSFDDSKDLKL
mgnify:FL=1